LGRQGALDNSIHVPAGMNQLERPPVRPLRLVDVGPTEHAVRNGSLTDHRVLADGKTVARGEIDREAGGGPGAHRRMGKRGERGKGGRVLRLYKSTASASATFRTAPSSSAVNGPGSSLSISICPRMTSP